MAHRPSLVIGSGHLAFRVKQLLVKRGAAVSHVSVVPDGGEAAISESVTRALDGGNLGDVSAVYLVDDRDERNLECLLVLASLVKGAPIVASLFNESLAPHLEGAHGNVRVLNPAKIAAGTFVAALDSAIARPLGDASRPPARPKLTFRSDALISSLVVSFAALCAAAVAYFHFAEELSWLDSLYFVVVTVATVGYGDVNMLNAAAASKIVNIGLIFASTVFIWVIFSLTIDQIIKKRVELSLGRRRYAHRDHVIVCGLGRLAYFVAEGLLDRGERVIVVERSAESPAIARLRARGAHVYVGDARLPGVLESVGVGRAKALYSLIGNDYANIEIGLSARTSHPGLRLVLRIYDDAMAQKIRETLDIHLSLSMSAIVDERFLEAAEPVSRER